MIIDPVGSDEASIGNRIAIVDEGPKPGRTPTSVPNKQPIKQEDTFVKVKTLAKPCNKSIYRFSLPF
jgi:hypothetical protein